MNPNNIFQIGMIGWTAVLRSELANHISKGVKLHTNELGHPCGLSMEGKVIPFNGMESIVDIVKLADKLIKGK